jgi:hypothetical protein
MGLVGGFKQVTKSLAGRRGMDEDWIKAQNDGSIADCLQKG